MFDMFNSLKKAAMVGFVAMGLISCATPVNPTLISDGELAVEALQALDVAAGLIPGIPASALMLASDVLAEVQTDLTSLQSGVTTASAFATAVQAGVAKLQPIATDLKANATIVAGLNAINGLVPIIAADVAAQSASIAPSEAAISAPAARAAAQSFIASVKK